MNVETLARVRVIVLGLAGLICLIYSGLAFATNDPRPISPWLPLASGISAAAIISLCAIVAGRQTAEMAHDELYKLEWARAVQFSYWFGMVLFVIAAGSHNQGVVDGATAFASFGTAYGATPLLAFCVITLRG